MEKKIIVIMIWSFFVLLNPIQIYADSPEKVTLNQLIEESKVYDGKTVIVEGEALLEILERGNDAWININDGTNAMGVFLPLVEAQKIKRFGEYHTVGDTITIEAQFNRSSADHGGDMELRFIKYLKIESGYDREAALDVKYLWFAIFSSILTLIVALYYLQMSGRIGRLFKTIESFKNIK